MIKLLAPYLSHTKKILAKLHRYTIMPFIENPPMEKNNTVSNTPETKRINAAELFSMFTADIIKEEVVFTR